MYVLYFLAVFLLSMPVMAAEEAPKINVKIPDQMKGVSDAYKAAEEKLTDAQKAELEVLKKDHVSTLEPDINIITRAVYLDPCIKAGLMTAEDGAAFIKFRDHQNMIQDDIRNEFSQTRIAKIDYIDKDLLHKNLMLEQLVQLQVFGGMAQLKAERLTPEMLAKDCPEQKAFLSDYLKEQKL